MSEGRTGRAPRESFGTRYPGWRYQEPFKSLRRKPVGDIDRFLRETITTRNEFADEQRRKRGAPAPPPQVTQIDVKQIALSINLEREIEDLIRKELVTSASDFARKAGVTVGSVTGILEATRWADSATIARLEYYLQQPLWLPTTRVSRTSWTPLKY